MDDTERPRALTVRFVRAVALPVAVPVLILLATGCLYWIRAGVTAVPGPGVSDALALDELAGHG